MKKLLRKVKSININHYIACIITAGFLALTFFCFLPAFTRVWEGLRDIGTSIGFLIQETFDITLGATVTVNDFSTIPYEPFLLPETSEEFTTNWNNFWWLFFDWNNFVYYFFSTLLFLFNLLVLVLSVLIPIIIILKFAIKKFLKNENNKYNVDSKPLRIAKVFSDKVYLQIKRFVINFISFIKNCNVYLKIWLCIWLFNFNGFAILFETLAYYFYFAGTLNLSHFYVQIYKLFCDLSVMFRFIPVWCWVIIGYFLLCWLRRKIGYKRLNHHEMRNRGFINSLPLVVMNCGTMGSCKTTVLTDMALSQEVMYIDKALEKMELHSTRFPNYPWIELENAIKIAVGKHEIYNLYTCRVFVYELKKKNELFGYDSERYGTTYDDCLSLRTIWDVVESYAQLYFLYTLKTSFLIFNYSVRTSNIMLDKGNLPIWDTDFFKRQCADMEEESRFAHVLDFDAFRPGKKMKKNNLNSNFFEFGIVGITEFGKERGNMIELQHVKKEDEKVNQKNDLFNSWLKMMRHNATVDFDSYARVFSDEQRPESLGADARELAEILDLRDKSEMKLALPFFFLEDLLYDFLFSKYLSFYEKYRFNRGDNTLLFHVLKIFAHKIHRYYERIYNTFGYRSIEIDIQKRKEISTHKYYLSEKKIHSKRFATDAYSDLLAIKVAKSKIGLNDIATYQDYKAVFLELSQTNGYFFNEYLLGFLRNI